MLSSFTNIKLVLEYDGTAYHGFQYQLQRRTIQGELESALGRLTQEPARVIGAGRTDAGVHAAGQVVNFKTRSRLSAEELKRALNALLPPDIAVREASAVPEDFHARYSAKSRAYRYTILNRESRSALLHRWAYHVEAPLNVGAMDAACQKLVGRHDLACFGGAQAPGKGTVRRVYRAGCRREGDKVLVDLEADAFLPHMVRNIVGTLIWVGRGKIDLARIEAILASRDRRQAGPAAPPQGLCLMKVSY